MIPRWIRSAHCLIPVAFAAVLCGCGQNSYHKRLYVLDATRRDTPADVQIAAVLEVRRFTIDAAFAQRNLVYRIGPFEYKSDFYNEFLVAPAVAVTEKTRRWLASSGLFERVLMPGSRLAPTYTMEGNVTALCGDFRDETAPVAVMELRCFLVDDRDPAETVVFSRTYRASSPLQAKKAANLVAALDECLVEILTSLEEDLKEPVSDSDG